MCSQQAMFGAAASGAQPTNAQIMGMLGDASCDAMISAEVTRQLTAAGASASSDCTSASSVSCQQRCTQCTSAIFIGMTGAQTTGVTDKNGASCDTCQVCLPYLNCILGSSSSSSAPALVNVRMTASGSPSDYGSTQQTNLRQNMADSVGVALSAVSVRITAASVNIDFDITTTSTAQAGFVRSSIAANLGDATSASSVLGITVVSAPTATVSTTASSGSDSKSNTGLIIGIAAGAGGVVLILGGVVMMKMKGGKVSPSS